MSYMKQQIADTTDEVLLRRLGEGVYSDEGRAAAVAELHARGVDLAEYGLRDDGTVPGDEPQEDDDARHDDDTVADGSTPSDSLTAVARFHFPQEAHMLEARLLADGIPAFVTNAHSTQAFGYLRLALGGVRVLVPTARVDEALAVMAALEAGEYALDDGSDPDEDAPAS
jgi:hypothetical protein